MHISWCLGCDFFRKYTDTQIRIGRCVKVFPSHTVLIFLSAYLFCKIVFLLCRYADTHTTWEFFYLSVQIYLSAAQIKLCLCVKHSDRHRYAFAINIALICAKYLPSCIRGTLNSFYISGGTPNPSLQSPLPLVSPSTIAIVIVKVMAVSTAATATASAPAAAAAVAASGISAPPATTSAIFVISLWSHHDHKLLERLKGPF